MAKQGGEDPDQITIVGQGDKLFSFEKLKKTVVKIGNLFYFRDDDNLVWLDNGSGKLRAYRKTSPLIVQTTNGGYILKALATLTEDGIWLDPKAEDVVKIDGKYVRKSYCVRVDEKWYLLTDEAITKCGYTGNYFLKEQGVKLEPSFYGKNNIVHPKYKTVTTTKGEVIVAEDRYEYFDLDKGEIVVVHRTTSVARDTNKQNIVVDFQDKTNPQEDRLVLKHALSKQVTEKNLVSFSFYPGGNHFNIPAVLLPYFEDKRDNFIMPRYEKELGAIRAKLNKNYSDLDETENIAKVFQHISKPYPGKHNIYTPGAYSKTITKGKTFRKTAGIEFSFGVEFETSDGYVDPHILEDLKLMAVGDRSVGAGEYVTHPMSGDEGVEMLERICKLALSPHTLVDDRCGVHVHVGSLWKPLAPGDKAESYQKPSFSKNFLLNAVKLGSLIEEELYSSLPPSRKPTLYHCHSIRRFGDINEKNFDSRFGAYCFGPKEWWLAPTDNCPHSLWDLNEYKLGPDRNHNSSLGVWADGRYKWLNLIPSYTATKHRTIEFRIFPGTTTFRKTYAYLLTSLAFTYVLDNNVGIIKPGVTLSQVFAAAFKGYPKIISFMNEFYEERKAKFNRKEIYVDNKGKKLDLPFLK